MPGGGSAPQGCPGCFCHGRPCRGCSYTADCVLGGLVGGEQGGQPQREQAAPAARAGDQHAGAGTSRRLRRLTPRGAVSAPPPMHDPAHALAHECPPHLLPRLPQHTTYDFAYGASARSGAAGAPGGGKAAAAADEAEEEDPGADMELEDGVRAACRAVPGWGPACELGDGGPPAGQGRGVGCWLGWHAARRPGMGPEHSRHPAAAACLPAWQVSTQLAGQPPQVCRQPRCLRPSPFMPPAARRVPAGGPQQPRRAAATSSCQAGAVHGRWHAGRR